MDMLSCHVTVLYVLRCVICFDQSAKDVIWCSHVGSNLCHGLEEKKTCLVVTSKSHQVINSKECSSKTVGEEMKKKKKNLDDFTIWPYHPETKDIGQNIYFFKVHFQILMYVLSRKAPFLWRVLSDISCLLHELDTGSNFSSLCLNYMNIFMKVQNKANLLFLYMTKLLKICSPFF